MKKIFKTTLLLLILAGIGFSAYAWYRYEKYFNLEPGWYESTAILGITEEGDVTGIDFHRFDIKFEMIIKKDKTIEIWLKGMSDAKIPCHNSLPGMVFTVNPERESKRDTSYIYKTDKNVIQIEDRKSVLLGKISKKMIEVASEKSSTTKGSRYIFRKKE